jgi:uncharacterized damage-inducible protein DinB
MPIAEAFLKEFEEEMATTRRVLERVPGDKPDWKPHPKSFSIAHLAQLLSFMPGWVTNAARETGLDLGGFPGYSNQKPGDLLASFDKHVKEAKAALASAKDSDFAVMWSLKRGPMVLMSLPRGAVVRQTINHIVHHRGQMTVYLRLNDIPVPSIYGPTADERMPGMPPA